MAGLGNSDFWECICGHGKITVGGVSLVGAEIAKLGLEISAVMVRTNALDPFPQVRGEMSIQGH